MFLAAAVAGLAGSVRADGPPATRPATQPVAVSADDLASDREGFLAALGTPENLVDPAGRKATAPKVLPKLRTSYDHLMAAASSGDAAAADKAVEVTTLLAVFGDADAAARLTARAANKDPAVALSGQGQQLLVDWWQAGRDPATQAKVADRAEAVAKAHPTDVPLTVVLLAMSQVGPADASTAKRVTDLIAGTMKNDVADQAKAQSGGDAQLAALVGKPMTIAGQTPDAKPFTTADWKGKVVLVDHWATWCGPCRAELPRVEKIYADFHPQGLEILGVSNDQSIDDLKQFVTADKAMPWTQLFDPAAAAAQKWNPITTGFGVNGIPTMFLIDKHGVCRSVTAREDMEQLIPKLLAEK